MHISIWYEATCAARVLKQQKQYKTKPVAEIVVLLSYLIDWKWISLCYIVKWRRYRTLCKYKVSSNRMEDKVVKYSIHEIYQR